MTSRRPVAPVKGATPAPEAPSGTSREWQEILASLGTVAPRPDVRLAETPAPARLAPFTVAISAEVLSPERPGESTEADVLASGRFIVLHDPAGQEPWEGTTRIVTYATATVDTEMAVDPLLTGVAWSWLTEALDAGEVRRRAESATVTRTTSESFGALDAQPPVGDVEMRASWTPIDTELRDHLLAWTVLLATMAGLPPLPDTVSRFPVSGPFGPTR